MTSQERAMKPTSVRRWPVLSIIAVLLALMVVIELADDRSGSTGPGDDLPSSPAVTSLLGAPVTPDPAGTAVNFPIHETASWYCPTSWVAPQSSVTSALVVYNPDTDPVSLWVSYYPSIFEDGGLAASATGRSRSEAGRVVRHTVDGQGLKRIDVPADLIPADSGEIFVSSLVELDRPGALVLELLLDANGSSYMTCAEGVSPQWFFPAGTTTSDAHLVLGLFNPFQDSAVVDIEFATDDGIRSPSAYNGLIVAPNSALYLDVGAQAPRWAQLATSIKARSGQLVAGKLQAYDGSQGIVGASTTLGSAALQHQWLFPYGSQANQPTAYVIYNPGEAEARVEVDFRLDFDSVTPTELRIPPGQRYTVAVNVPADPDLRQQLPFHVAEYTPDPSGELDSGELDGELDSEPDSAEPAGGPGGATDGVELGITGQSSVVPVTLTEGHWAVVRTLSGAGVVAEQLRGGGEIIMPAETEVGAGTGIEAEADAGTDATTDAATETEAEGDTASAPASILDELDQVGQPEVVVRAGWGELGLSVAATRYRSLGGFSNGQIVVLEDGTLKISREGIAIANPSAATIARITNRADDKEYELGPRRRILLDSQDVAGFSSTTPVVIANGYPIVGSRQVPEVFNR